MTPLTFPCRRSGSMFVETAIGLSLAVVAMAAVAQLVAISRLQQREIGQQRTATQAVANAMEQAMALPWPALTTEEAAKIELDDNVNTRLYEPELAIEVTEDANESNTRQIQVSISWRNHAGQRVAPVSITAWKHRQPEALTAEPSRETD